MTAKLIELDGVVHVCMGTGIPETFRYVEERVAAHGLPLYVCRPPQDEATGVEDAEYRDMVLRHGFPVPG